MSTVSGAPVVTTRVPFHPDALLTPANLLTLTRIAATPAFLWLLTRHPSGWDTWAAWFVLCTTDLLDGKLARCLGPTRSGAFLDPLADKVLVLGAFAVLVAGDRVWWVPAVLIATREVTMSWYRSWIGRRGISVPANKAAKVKTWVQCIAVGLVVMPPSSGHPLVYGAVVWLAVSFTVVTGAVYAFQGRRLALVQPLSAAA